MNGSIEYDIEEVIRFCESGAPEAIGALVKDLNALADELDDCEDKFHCKGGDESNALMRIYRGFSAAIGKNNGSYSGEGCGGLVAASAQIVNTCYAEARADLKAQEMAQFANFKF